MEIDLWGLPEHDYPLGDWPNLTAERLRLCLGEFGEPSPWWCGNPQIESSVGIEGGEMGETWKSGDTCIWRETYGTISYIVQGTALVEFEDYVRVNIRLDQLTRPPRLSGHRPTGRWDSGERLAPTTRKPSNGAVGGSLTGEKQPKDGHGGR